MWNVNLVDIALKCVCYENRPQNDILNLKMLSLPIFALMSVCQFWVGRSKFDCTCIG